MLSSLVLNLLEELLHDMLRPLSIPYLTQTEATKVTLCKRLWSCKKALLCFYKF